MQSLYIYIYIYIDIYLYFFFVHKMFNSGITIQVCRRHLFLLYSVASDRAISTQPKMASKRTQNFNIQMQNKAQQTTI